VCHTRIDEKGDDIRVTPRCGELDRGGTKYSHFLIPVRMIGERVVLVKLDGVRDAARVGWVGTGGNEALDGTEVAVRTRNVEWSATSAIGNIDGNSHLVDEPHQ
jgi:hypothetical protein